MWSACHEVAMVNLTATNTQRIVSTRRRASAAGKAPGSVAQSGKEDIQSESTHCSATLIPASECDTEPVHVSRKCVRMGVDLMSPGSRKERERLLFARHCSFLEGRSRLRDGVSGTARVGAADGGVMRKGNSMQSHPGVSQTVRIPDRDDMSVCVEERS